jgi:ferredoxin
MLIRLLFLKCLRLGTHSKSFFSTYASQIGGLTATSRHGGPEQSWMGVAVGAHMAVGAAILCSASCYIVEAHARGALAHSLGRGLRTARSCRAAAGPVRMEQDRQEGNGLCRVRFKGVELPAKRGQTLRTALLRSGVATPHNGSAQLINCRGLGTCGTCAVEIRGEVWPASWNAKERLRLNFHPHASPGNERLRLACQVRVEGDLEVTKYDKFWGQGDAETADRSFSTPFGELEFLLDAGKR